jgi:hypothetical protein
VLGDVTVALIGRTDEQVVRDTRLGEVGKDLRAQYKNALRAGAGFGAEHERTLGMLRTLERQARNNDPGYWIAAHEPHAALHAMTYETSGILAAVLATDGAAAAVTRYSLFDNWRRFGEAVRHDPDHFRRCLRDTELSDPLGQRWPRSKASDDAVALVVAAPTTADR